MEEKQNLQLVVFGLDVADLRTHGEVAVVQILVGFIAGHDAKIQPAHNFFICVSSKNSFVAVDLVA